MTKYHSPHKIGLGQAFLNRAGLIFSLMILVVLLSGGSAVYAEYKTGQLNEKVVKPVKKFASEVIKAFEEKDPPKNLTNPNVLISTSSATIKIESDGEVEIKTNNGTTVKSTIKKTTSSPTPTPKAVQYNTKSYEQSVKEMNEKADKAWEEALKRQSEWSAQKKAENQKWYEEQTTKNEAESKAWFDQKVQESQQSLEQWKKEHGF